MKFGHPHHQDPLQLLGSALLGALLILLGSGVPGAAQVPACKTNLTGQLRKLSLPALSAAIVKNGRLICTTAAGMANLEKKIPATADTLFLIASVSKTITATALMQLYDKGLFALDDDINKFLPFTIRIPVAPSASITFRQLLNHTSSLRDNVRYINCPDSCSYGTELIPFVTKHGDSPIPLASFLKEYFTPEGAYYDKDANFEQSMPGNIARYSNIGIALAGYLVELLSGRPFDEYCAIYIFEPLEMRQSTWRLAGASDALLAMPYNKGWFGFVPYGQYGEPDYPDGMLRTSPQELANFLLAYMENGRYKNRQILLPTTVQEVLKIQSSLNSTLGLVWFNRSIDGRKMWGHEGSDNGAGAKMWFDPSTREGVIILTNGVWDDDDELLSLLFDEADDYD